LLFQSDKMTLDELNTFPKRKRLRILVICHCASFQRRLARGLRSAAQP
jgi:hypothetical protein